MVGAAKLVGRVLDQQAAHYEAMRVSATKRSKLCHQAIFK